ncbi:hypothetical protein BO85DRAFT_33780 [Aspergillus piperis CBS 112811]|uniref:Uncharacterized protein n=1 Tax=Aspergillus piperis CBS 112811 TaxID=1448313 RepID=A0A8G1R085_9EURO|nr:hypothetical protein BO85DRAFT_33780 [Aspergillus piperis CBS 112811]RAH57133.1 hypothetical protein BO85DRAFT_33780 [Aspergillus piperis CBS 112811]
MGTRPLNSETIGGRASPDCRVLDCQVAPTCFALSFDHFMTIVLSMVTSPILWGLEGIGWDGSLISAACMRLRHDACTFELEKWDRRSQAENRRK